MAQTGRSRLQVNHEKTLRQLRDQADGLEHILEEVLHQKELKIKELQRLKVQLEVAQEVPLSFFLSSFLISVSSFLFLYLLYLATMFIYEQNIFKIDSFYPYFDVLIC